MDDLKTTIGLFILLFPTLSTILGVIIWVAKLQLSNEFNNRLSTIEIKLTKRDEDQAEQIRTLVHFVMRFAEPEAIRVGLLTPGNKSPTDKAKQTYKPHLEELFNFYQTLQSDLPKEEVILAVMSHFDSKFVETICPNLNIDKGACILVAIELAKQQYSQH